MLGGNFVHSWRILSAFLARGRKGLRPSSPCLQAYLRRNPHRLGLRRNLVDCQSTSWQKAPSYTSAAFYLTLLKTFLESDNVF